MIGRRRDCVVPFAVENGALDVEGLHLVVGHDDALGIGFVVEFASNGQAGVGGRRADQVDDDAIADERFGAPVLGDEREQAMLDLVPFAGSRRQMMNFDGEPSSSARRCNSSFHNRTREPFDPPPSAVMIRRRARG